MKNKQHKYILKAFLESKLPVGLRFHNNLILLDSILAGYATQLLDCGSVTIDCPIPIIAKEDQTVFSDVINNLTGYDKDELVIYYRLAILVEKILLFYNRQ